MDKTNYFFSLALLVLGLLNIPTFASDINLESISILTNTSISDTFTQEIYSEYLDAVKVEFIANNTDLYYFRVFEEKGSMNYKVIEYDANSSIMKELVWIWSKNYDADIRTIQLQTSEIGGTSAKVYLRDGKTIDEKINFIDPLNSFEFVEVDMSNYN